MWKIYKGYFMKVSDMIFDTWNIRSDNCLILYIHSSWPVQFVVLIQYFISSSFQLHIKICTLKILSSSIIMSDLISQTLELINQTVYFVYTDEFWNTHMTKWYLLHHLYSKLSMRSYIMTKKILRVSSTNIGEDTFALMLNR